MKSKNNPKKVQLKPNKKEVQIILDYTRQELAAGYSLDAIKQRLLGSGYDINIINRVFYKFNFSKKSDINNNNQPEVNYEKNSFGSKFLHFEDEVKKEASQIWDSIDHKLHNKLVLFYLGVIVVMLIIALMSLIVFTSTYDCDNDIDCFYSMANSCEDSKVILDYFGSTILLESTKACVLRKTIIDMAPDEPETVLNLFLGRDLSCDYKQGNLKYEHIKDLRSGLSLCQGPLKNAIYDSIISTYQISNPGLIAGIE